MKKITSQKLIAFTLFLFGIFYSINLTAQTCNGNKVWACRFTASCNYECKCVNANNVDNWISHGEVACHCVYGCPVRLANPSDDEISISLFPNPASTLVTIQFSIEEAGKVSITATDITGRFIAQIASSEYATGGYEFNWDVSSINAGIYFVKMSSEGYEKTEKLFVVK